MYDEENKLKKALDNLKERLTIIRAGRANPAMLNGVNVMYYGVPTPLQSIATISVPEARKLFVKPFDKTAIKDISRAINEADLGINPTDNGETVILSIPDLTEERRREYVKMAKAMGEECKVAIRNIRQDVKDSILKDEYPEDEEKHLLNDLQELVNKFNKLVDEEINLKEKELMSI